MIAEQYNAKYFIRREKRLGIIVVYLN